MLVHRSTVGTATISLFSSYLAVCTALGCADSSVESDDKECEEEADCGEFNDVQGFDEAWGSMRRRPVERRRAVERRRSERRWKT